MSSVTSEQLGGEPDRGVVAGSAGNHAWALALAARERGVPCEVVMPPDAPLGKIEGSRNLGATVEEGTWVVTSYLVSNAIILPMAGWLANRFGRFYAPDDAVTLRAADLINDA